MKAGASKPNKRLRLFLISLGVLLVCVPLASLPLIRNDPPAHADAIVVIGGDHKPQRIQRAVELYQSGYAPVVILSAGTLVTEGSEQMAEVEVMRRQALALGLPPSVIVIEDQSQSTFQNAYYTKQIADQMGFKSVLLVTSAYQSRRAGRIFSDVFGLNISIQIQPAPLNICALCWWFQPDQTRVVFYEYYNWARYWLGIRLPAEGPPGPTH